MNVALVMFKADGTRRDFPLHKDRVILGRQVNCDLRIPLTSVSRQHCEVTLDIPSQHIRIKDLGSSNGTFHNSVRVTEATLSAGDEVVVGPVVFTVVVDGVPDEIKPVRTILGDQQEDDTLSPQISQGSAIDDSDAMTMPTTIEAEEQTPTVDLDLEDDDPIAALQRLADAEDDDEDRKSRGSDFDLDDSELALLLGDDDET